MVIVLILVGVTAVIAIAAVPFLLPWPQQVRWLVASTTVPDPVGMSLGGYPLRMREVAVGDVDPSAERVTVELVEISPPGRPRRYVLSGDAATLAATARLNRWAAAHTPLLLVADADGDSSLHGPAHAVVGLHPLPPGDDLATPGLLPTRSLDQDPGRQRRWVPTLVSR
jgi:hypothetical protein